MWQKLLALIGALLFVLAVGLGMQLLVQTRQATRVDEPLQPAHPVIVRPAACIGWVQPEIGLARRVMSERESQALTVRLANAGSDVCTIEVGLNAPDFVISPPATAQTATVEPNSEQDVSWILSPRQPGRFDITVTVGGATTVLGLTVTTILGLTAWQAEILAGIGTFLGPLLTAPWWYEQWQKWRRGREVPGEAKGPSS